MAADIASAKLRVAKNATSGKLAVRITVGASGRPRTVLASNAADHTVDAVPSNAPRSYIWHVWPARNWPLVADEEAEFVERLRELAAAKRPRRRGTRKKHERSDTTNLLNALRCGLSCDELFEHAPGLRPDLLLAAYEELDQLRANAVEAFERIIEDRSLEALVNYSQTAGVLMSVAVRRMTPAGEMPADEAVAVRIARVLVEIERVRAQADAIEADLARCTPPDARAVEIGRMLYDPYDPALWSDPYYVPRRVGDLVPLRVADLLGERRP